MVMFPSIQQSVSVSGPVGVIPPVILTFEKLPANPPPDIAASVPRGPVVDCVGFVPMVPLMTGGAVGTGAGVVVGATVGGAGSVVWGGATVIGGAAVVGVGSVVGGVVTVVGGFVATVVGAATVVVGAAGAGLGIVVVANVVLGVAGVVGGGVVAGVVGGGVVVGVVVAEGLAPLDRISSEMSIDALESRVVPKIWTVETPGSVDRLVLRTTIVP